MPERAREVHPTTAIVRVRAFVEAWRTDRRMPGASVVTAVTAPNGLGTVPLYLADLAALVGDPEPPEPPMPRDLMPRDPLPEFPDRDPNEVPW